MQMNLINIVLCGTSHATQYLAEEYLAVVPVCAVNKTMGTSGNQSNRIANANVKQMAMDLQDVVYLQEWKVAQICLLWI